MDFIFSFSVLIREHPWFPAFLRAFVAPWQT
jgi:hypothetical protein